MQPPNILITNFCNQNCSFCFARAEMNTTKIDREMEVKNFASILKQMKASKTDTVKLLGGEPMLHSQLDKILELSLKSFPFVQIFSNGIFSDEKTDLVSQYFPRIKFTFNLMTPGFQFNKKIRQTVINRILKFGSQTKITLSLTIDPATDLDFVLKTITKEVIQTAADIRIGFSNPTAGEKNYYTFDKFPKMGEQLYKLVRFIKDTGSTARMHLNCGFTRCMFTDGQHDYLMKTGLKFLGWGCFGKSSSMDIATNMTAFHCFPLSTKHRLPVTTKNIPGIDKDLLSKRYEYWKNVKQKICVKCPFYGHVPGKCPGPCIAFLINNSTASKTV